MTPGRVLPCLGFVVLARQLLSPALVFLHGVDRTTAWFSGQPRQRRFGLASRFQFGAQTALGLLFFPLTLLLLGHFRRREYAADERAVRVTGKPTALARSASESEGRRIDRLQP